MPNFHKAKAEEFVDEIFWVDILSKINLESKEEEKIEIKIDDWDWIIRKSYLPIRFEGDKELIEIGIYCGNSNYIPHTPKTKYYKNLVDKRCCCYLEGTYFDRNSKGYLINKKTITRNGFHFGYFIIKQLTKKQLVLTKKQLV